MFIQRNREKWPTITVGNRVNDTRTRESNSLRAKTRHPDRPEPTIARFLFDGPVLPLVTQTLPVAEAFRQALMKQYQRCRHRREYGHARQRYQEQFWSAVLSGKDADGQILREHCHAFYLPTAEGSDPRWITHVTVAAAAGFGSDEVAALNALRRLTTADEQSEPRVQLVGSGSRQDFRAPLLDESCVWHSATPFVVTRYPKLRGRKRDRPENYASPRDFARHVLQQELERRTDLPSIALIEEEEFLGVSGIRAIQFQRYRKKQGDEGGRRPTGMFRLTFTSPVRGPLCLGHSCHFGLGLFLPLSSASLREAR